MKRFAILLKCVVAIVFLAGANSSGAEARADDHYADPFQRVQRTEVAQVDPQEQAAEPQTSKELKAGLSPQEAARHMSVPPGFRVQLAAGEPRIHQPIALAFDHRGRLWVAEAYTYPQRAPEGQGKDKIVILEDTTGDGELDSRKVFIEGLNLVSGLEVGFGGVWVGAAPYFMFIPDRDGDDRPDAEPRILLDGFGYQDTHETLNSFNWGPDGWLYGCHGVFTHSKVGKPGTADDQRTPLNAGVWRYHPQRHEFEVFAYGTSNPWGVDFNDQGQGFATACVIPHLWHVIQGARYDRQGGQHFNPHIYENITTIADHAHYEGNIRDHAWWGHEPLIPASTSAAGGGHAHCGAMIYLGDNWPEKHRNQIFMNNVHGNRVNNDLLVRRDSGFVGKHGPDLLLANDRWFRGINLRYGPDGSVYLIDWYDKNACHRNTPEIWDRTNGRVYRVVYGNPAPARVDMKKLSDQELVELHKHRNDWYVRMARKELQQRGGSVNSHGALRRLLAESDRNVRLRALWTLHVTGGLTEEMARPLLEDADEYVRAWTIQLQLEDRRVSPSMLAQLAEMAKRETSPVVRLYLASALQRLPVSARWDIAAGLASHAEDSQDPNLPLMIWYGVEPLVSQKPAEALLLARQGCKLEKLSRFIARRAASDESSRNVVVAALCEIDSVEQRIMLLDEILRALEGRVEIPMPPAWKEAYDALRVSESQQVQDRADQIAVALGDVRVMSKMRQLLLDGEAALPKRRQALAILVRGDDKQAAPAYRAALTVPPLRGAALRALSASDDPQTPPAILAIYAQLTEEEKRDAVNTLSSRPSFALELLEAIDRNKVASKDLHAYNIRQLRAFHNERLNRRIKDVWGEIRESTEDKKQLIAKWRRALTAPHDKAPDPSNGRRLFTKTCATCHTLFGVGEKIGPDITGSNRANLDYILENVIDPSAVLGKDYRMTVIATENGRVISGLVMKETDSALTVRTINDTVVVAKSEIEEQQLSNQSMMPERLLDPLAAGEVRDLISYLASPTQVGLRGPEPPLDPKTGKTPGAIEGESIKILSKTRGAANSQPMGAFPADRWSGNDQLWWTGARPGDRLELELPVAADGDYTLEAVLTKARDYGVVQLWLDGAKLGAPIDLFNSPDVITTGVLTFENQQLKAGAHRLTVEIIGANPQAAPAYMFGLDYVRAAAVEAAGQ